MPQATKNNNNKSSNNIVFDFVEIHAKSERPFFCEILNKRRESLNAKGKKTLVFMEMQILRSSSRTRKPQNI